MPTIGPEAVQTDGAGQGKGGPSIRPGTHLRSTSGKPIIRRPVRKSQGEGSTRAADPRIRWAFRAGRAVLDYKDLDFKDLMGGFRG